MELRPAPLALAALLGFAALVAPSPARADHDWAVRRNPFDPRTIARYKSLLEKHPDDAAALAKLVDLYARHSNPAKLVREYEAKVAADAADRASAEILGHLRRRRGELDLALAAYERAAAADPTAASPLIARGEVLRQKGRPAEALAAYEEALARSRSGKKPILTTLADLATVLSDSERAVRYRRDILALDPGDVPARLELAEALAQAKAHGEAAVELGAAADRAKSDPARWVEIEARLGREQEEAGKEEDAEATYRRAIAATQKGHHLHKELTERIIEIHRRRQDLFTLIGSFENDWPVAQRGAFEWEVLARLHESTGDTNGALEAYRRAVKAAPAELDTQRRLIALQELSGRADEAIAQYEALIRIAPGEPRFPIELAERIARRGDTKRALELLREVARRFPDDAGAHEAVAALYARWGEDAEALAEYETLVRIEPDDPAHLVNLGEQHFQRGDRGKAVEIWRRIAAAKTAEAFGRLAAVYAEHDMGDEAIEVYSRAIALAPRDATLARGLATVLERGKRDDPAVEAWERVLALAAQDPAGRPLAREARTRIVGILARKPGNPLLAKRREWQRRFEATPPDLEAGRFLAEADLKLGRNEDAERTLTVLTAKDASDDDALHQLVAVKKGLHKLDEAIELLTRLAASHPGAERDYYTQIADLELALYRDDAAIAYAEKALSSSPADAQAQERLGQIYEKREDFPRAIAAYERAIALSPKRFDVHFALARLRVRTGRPDQAARLYREIVRRASDEDIVRSAARKAIDLEEYLGTLGELEKEIVPLAFASGGKTIFRRVLVDLYDRHVPPLVDRAARGDAAARIELSRLGEHGMRPLLEALGDSSDPAQQRSAVRILGYLGNRGAAAPLAQLAADAPAALAANGRSTGTDGPDVALRLEALRAAGRLGDPHVLPLLARLAHHGDKDMRAAAAWALGATAEPRAVPVIGALLDDAQPSVTATACLAAGRLGDHRLLGRAADAVADTERPPIVRAACACALGLGDDSAHASALISALTDGNDEVVRSAAWAAGQLGDRRAIAPLLTVYFASRGEVRQVAVAAIAKASTGRPGAGSWRALDAADASVDRLLDTIVAPPPEIGIPADALHGQRAAIVAAIRAAFVRHRDVVLATLVDLEGASAADDLIALGPLGDAVVVALRPNDRTELTRTLAEVGRSIAPDLERLAEHADPEVRARALSVLYLADRERAATAVVPALADTELMVRLGALAIAGRLLDRDSGEPTLAARLGPLLAAELRATDWRERAAAVAVTASLASSAAATAIAAALADSSGFVREAAVKALSSMKHAERIEPLLAASKDEVAEVRLAAATALVESGDPRARGRLAELAASDPDVRVRAAAQKP